MASGERGLHLAVVDESGALVGHQVFATHERSDESERLVDALGAVPQQHVVMLAIKGDRSTYLTEAAVRFLIDQLGSTFAHRWGRQDYRGLAAAAT
ncbi:MAG TPA: hypothetical protein EYQ83_15555, partial [Acidobacteria bacterium]|nr:hypothetical protein [Acidobacteriota bacterium]